MEKNMEKLFKSIHKYFKITDFYHCLFVTCNTKKNTIFQTSKGKQVVPFFLILVHLVQVVCQIIAVTTRASTLAELAGGISLGGGYFITLLFRADLKRDAVPGQMLNFIASKRGKKYISTQCSPKQQKGMERHNAKLLFIRYIFCCFAIAFLLF